MEVLGFFVFWWFGGWGFLGLLLLVYVGGFFEVAHSLVFGFFGCLFGVFSTLRKRFSADLD